MEPRLRVMTIRLMEILAEQPDYAADIGVEGQLMKRPPAPPEGGSAMDARR